MPFGIDDAIMIGSTLLGGASSILGGREQSGSADQARELAREQYDQTRRDTAPYRHIAGQALNAMGSIYGYSPYNDQTAAASGETIRIGDTSLPVGTTTVPVGGGWYEVWYQGQRVGTLRPGGSHGRFVQDAGSAPLPRPGQPGGVAGQPAAGTAPGGGPSGPDYSAFFQSPDYNFRRSEGMRGIENSFAARGSGRSGNALRALADFNSNLASGEFGNYFGRQATLAGFGPAAVNTVSNAGQNYASNAGNAYMAAGDARASGISGVNDALQGGLQDYMFWRMMQGKSGGTPDYFGGG